MTKTLRSSQRLSASWAQRTIPIFAFQHLLFGAASSVWRWALSYSGNPPGNVGKVPNVPQDSDPLSQVICPRAQLVRLPYLLNTWAPDFSSSFQLQGSPWFRMVLGAMGMVHLEPRVPISSAFWPHTPYTHTNTYTLATDQAFSSLESSLRGAQIMIQKSCSLQNLLYNISHKLSHLREDSRPPMLLPSCSLTANSFFHHPTYPAGSHHESITSMTLCP